MSKVEKIWLWISLAMFLVPEVLFFTSPALMMSINGKSFSEINSLIIKYDIFFDYPIYLLVIIAIEFLGILSLLILNIKNKKTLFIILFSVILIWLFFAFALVYVTGIMMNF